MAPFLLIALLLAPPPLQATPPAEVVDQVQLRGNVATSDDEMRRLAGIVIGMPVTPDTLSAIAARLRASKQFDRVEVLKRYASITDPTKIVLVVIVDEGSVKIQTTGDPDHPTRVVRRWGPNLLFAPIVGSESGYGATYGVRVTHPEPAGRNSRISFPATWGGQKRVGAEFEKRYPGAWITRLESGGSASRRKNPRFETDDDRQTAWLRAEHGFTPSFRVRALSGWQRVSFQGERERIVSVGAEAILDTRLDPFLARNAVFLRASSSHLDFRERRAVNRTDFEAHGYLGLFRQTILVAGLKKESADGSLPDFLKPLLGGPSSVRGFRTGTAAGDSLVAGSIELRVPLTSPLSLGRIGVSAFMDAGTVYDDGERFADQALMRGAGGSVWFTAAFLRVNVAVAHGAGSSTRVQLLGNLTF